MSTTSQHDRVTGTHTPEGTVVSESVNGGGAGKAPVATASYDRAFTMSSLVAFGRGESLAYYAGPSELEMGMIGVPVWAIRLLESFTGVSLKQLGFDLIEGANASIDGPDPYVTLRLFGSVRYGHYHAEVTWEQVSDG